MYYNTRIEIKKLELAVNYFNDYISKNFAGKKVKLNWISLYEDLFYNGTFNSYDEYKIIINLDSNKEIDKLDEYCEKYFDKIIERNEPIGNFFIFEDKKDIIENNKINVDIIRNREEILFNNRPCCKCKHFTDKVFVVDSSGIEISIDYILKFTEKNIEDVKQKYYIVHHENCELRDKIISDLNKNDTYPFDIEKRTNEKIKESKDIPLHFMYKMSENNKPIPWSLNSKTITECKCFEDSGITFEDFIEKYHTIE